jgi:hypothetical protein
VTALRARLRALGRVFAEEELAVVAAGEEGEAVISY